MCKPHWIWLVYMGIPSSTGAHMQIIQECWFRCWLVGGRPLILQEKQQMRVYPKLGCLEIQWLSMISHEHIFIRSHCVFSPAVVALDSSMAKSSLCQLIQQHQKDFIPWGPTWVSQQSYLLDVLTKIFSDPTGPPLPLGRAASLSEGVTSDPPKLPAAKHFRPVTMSQEHPPPIPTIQKTWRVRPLTKRRISVLTIIDSDSLQCEKKNIQINDC